MRVTKPSFIRESEASFHNVIDYGLSAVNKARQASLSKHNIINGMIEASQEQGTSMSDFSLGSQASALIIAGSGTTAASLTYGVWAVLQHPEVRKKLEEEVKTLPEEFDDVALEKLPYLDAVITETLRLYGSAPGALPRVRPSKGITVQDHYIPPGVVVTTQSYTMHRDPAIFPDPEK